VSLYKLNKLVFHNKYRFMDELIVFCDIQIFSTLLVLFFFYFFRMNFILSFVVE